LVVAGVLGLVPAGLLLSFLIAPGVTVTDRAGLTLVLVVFASPSIAAFVAARVRRERWRIGLTGFALPGFLVIGFLFTWLAWPAAIVTLVSLWRDLRRRASDRLNHSRQSDKTAA